VDTTVCNKNVLQLATDTLSWKRLKIDSEVVNPVTILLSL